MKKCIAVRAPIETQQAFPFVRKSLQRERAFKAAMIAMTGLAMAVLLAASPVGRYAVVAAANRVRWGVHGLVGLEPERADIEAERRAWRELGIVRVRRALAEAATEGGPDVQHMLKTAHMDADSAVIRWGNYDGTLVLSSDVFAPDDTGRSYRFKPHTRSVWFIGLTLYRALCMFQVLDEPEVRAACAGAQGRLVPGSVQMTNSWGCRGPEPDPSAPLRGIVLGDSVMQGLLVGDAETPPACLERALAKRTGMRVSVLNTGVLGYSPEQYYFTLLEFGKQMRPQFVVVSLCGNDFGSWDDLAGWREGAYWLGLIAQYCRTRRIVCLMVPWPGEESLLGGRDDSIYPGQISHLLKLGGAQFFYPIEAFTNEELRSRIERMSEPPSPPLSRLYNGHLLGDTHFSPLGCAFWGKVVAERLGLILERQRMAAPRHQMAKAEP